MTPAGAGHRRAAAGGPGGGGLQTWRAGGEFAPSVGSGYGQSGGQAGGTGIQNVKSTGAERVVLPPVIFTHESLSNYGLQPHVGAGMLLHGLVSAGHEAWERDTRTHTRGRRTRDGERSGGGEERIHSEHISAKRHGPSSPRPPCWVSCGCRWGGPGCLGPGSSGAFPGDGGGGGSGGQRTPRPGLLPALPSGSQNPPLPPIPAGAAPSGLTKGGRGKVWGVRRAALLREGAAGRPSQASGQHWARGGRAPRGPKGWRGAGGLGETRGRKVTDCTVSPLPPPTRPGTPVPPASQAGPDSPHPEPRGERGAETDGEVGS